MQCRQCRHEVPSDAQFCPECGARLGITCPECGTDNALAHKFCKKCGHALGSAPAVEKDSARFASPQSYTPRHLAEKILTSKSALEGERKQVTVLFADLKSSMELLADRDPEEARKILDPVLELTEAVNRHRLDDRESRGLPVIHDSSRAGCTTTIGTAVTVRSAASHRSADSSDRTIC